MNICLFGAGSKYINHKFVEVGYDLGVHIALNNHALIFGGGNDGLVGAVARGVNDNNGQIIGIMPKWMGEFEDLFEYCDKIIYTDGMDSRKTEFINNSDVFIISPGGIGTLDEFFEVLTLKKLKKHEKEIIILNTDNYFDDMLKMLENMTEKSFISENDDKLYKITSNVEECIYEINKL